MKKELLIFLYSIIYGLAYGFSYGVLMTNRKVIKHIEIFEYIEDLLYSLVVLVLSVGFIITQNEGVFRGYIIYGMFGGIIIYFTLLDPLIKPIHIFIIDCFKELFKLIVNIYIKVKEIIIIFIKICISLKIKNHEVKLKKEIKSEK